MAFSAEFNKELVTFGGIDIVFDERGSQFLTMRKVQWVTKGTEPDESKAKYEIRKYTIGKDGEEVCGKGVSFLTEEGPHNLVKELVENGFGHTKDVLTQLFKRDDFKETVEHLSDDESYHVDKDGEYFDMRSLLLGVIEDTNKEDEEIDEVV